jgi:hypothetical protein
MGTGHFPLFAILLVITLWIVVGLVNSHVTGWASLAERFRSGEGFSGDRLRFRSAAMRYWGHFGTCLTIGANPQGFFLAMSIPLFPGFPPLFIPWNEICLRRTRFLWTNYVELRLGQEPAIPFRISERLASKLAALAGEAWPKESPA